MARVKQSAPDSEFLVKLLTMFEVVPYSLGRGFIIRSLGLKVWGLVLRVSGFVYLEEQRVGEAVEVDVQVRVHLRVQRPGVVCSI